MESNAAQHPVHTNVSERKRKKKLKRCYEAFLTGLHYMEGKFVQPETQSADLYILNLNFCLQTTMTITSKELQTLLKQYLVKY